MSRWLSHSIVPLRCNGLIHAPQHHPGSDFLNNVIIHTHGRGLLFASDFRKHVEAAELLMAALPCEAEAELAALDLLLRWAVVRLCDPHGNTTCLLRMLELCQALLGLLVDAGGQLSQYEALCLLPCLVEKAGHNQARVACLDHVWFKEKRLRPSSTSNKERKSCPGSIIEVYVSSAGPPCRLSYWNVFTWPHTAPNGIACAGPDPRAAPAAAAHRAPGLPGAAPG